MRLINALSMENKLEVLTELSENLKLTFNKKDTQKEILLDELFGSWAKVDGKLTDDIIKSRTVSDRIITLD